MAAQHGDPHKSGPDSVRGTEDRRSMTPGGDIFWDSNLEKTEEHGDTCRVTCCVPRKYRIGNSILGS